MAASTETMASTSRVSVAGSGEASRRGRLWRWFRKYPVLPAAILVLLVLTAMAGPALAPYERDIANLRDRHLRPFSTGFRAEGEVRPDHQVRAWWPGSFHLLGTDHVGRDIFTRLLHGARISLVVLVISLTSGVVVGSTLGLIAGWYRGFVDETITRLVDIWMALPFVLLATVITLIFGRSVTVLVVVLMLFSWVAFIRIVRAETLRLKERDYVDIARINGASQIWIIRKHLLPHVMPTILVVATNLSAALITADAIINFLGLGFDRTIPSWGNLINESRDYLAVAPHQFISPGLTLLAVAFATMFLGDWLRERLNPNLRAVH